MRERALDVMTRFRLVSTPASRRAFAVVALGAALAVQAPLPASAQPAQTAQTADQARELFQKGKKDYAANKKGEALKAFRDAFAILKSHDIAANLATVEMELAFYREAAEHATFALQHFPPSVTEGAIAAMQDIVVKARKEIGTVTVRISVERAAVTVDGKPAGESPLPSEVFLDPGEHTIAASASGFEPAKETLRTGKGSTHLVTLTLKKSGGTSGGGGGGGGEVPPPSGPRPIAIAGFVTAGVAAGLGAAFAILAKVKDSDADAQLDAIDPMHKNPTACAGATPVDGCEKLHDLRASRDTFANAALWSFVGAGAVTAGTLIYTFAVPPKAAPAKASRLVVLPAAGPSGGGLLVRGAF
jgi:hypothetical protein